MRRASISLLLAAGIACQPTPDPKARTHSPAPAAQPVLGWVPDTVIPAGTELRVRLDRALSTSGNRPGDRFTGSLVEEITANHRTALPRGIGVSGHIRLCAPSNRPEHPAVLSLTLDRVDLDGRTYQVATAPLTRTSDDHKNAGRIDDEGLRLVNVGTGTATPVRRDLSLPVASILTFRISHALAVKASD